MRYSFRSNNFSGYTGEIPCIMIDSTFDDLPSISQLYKVAVDILCSEKWLSRLDLLWKTKENVMLRVLLDANHPKLMEQYKENKQVAEQIVDLLTRSLPGSKKQDMVLLIDEVLNESDAPENLLSAIRQISTWRKYIDSLDSNGFSHIYSSQINEGWYVLPIESEVIWTPRQGPYDPGFYISNPLRFDSATQPPEIYEKYIYWKLPDSRVIVMLPHRRTEQRIIDCYGYGKQYQAFLEEQEKTRQQSKDREKRLFKDRAQEKEQKNAQLRAELLS